MTDTQPEASTDPVDEAEDVPRVDFDVHSGEDLGDLDRAVERGKDEQGKDEQGNGGADWPAGGAPDTDDDGGSSDPNETGPHGEAVHQSDS